ncbi:MAG: lipase maturation factor family protein [Gammaproteobacteria bacterium]
MSAHAAGNADVPVLVFDGDCGFCRYWVDYWQRLTGARVRYRPYQDAAADYPAVPRAAFAGAIYLFEPDGTWTRGAAAAFRVLARVPGHGHWWRLYCMLPPYAWAAERAYVAVARHRVAAARVSRLLWGPERVPARYARVSEWFLHLLGWIYLAAFASFGCQVLGLVGREGILPLGLYLSRAHEALGTRAYTELPMAFWAWSSDQALVTVCGLGMVAAFGIVTGWWRRVSLVVAYLLYLSLFHAGQFFTGFQWDLLLLEVGFLACFLPGGSPVVIGLLRWLAFRFLFLAGIPKLQSGDPTWWSLTALETHFETQPLPSPLAWWAHSLPDVFLRAGAAGVLLIELVAVFAICLPRRPRIAFAACVVAFQGLIMLTGNFNFFNLLTILLCLPLLDDAALPGAARDGAGVPRSAFAWRRGLTGILVALYVGVGLVQMFEQLAQARAWAPLSLLYRVTQPWHIVNGYGLFARMTTTRAEIVIEASDDRRHWHAYRFRYKPDGPHDAPGWNIPHQPRLDWQMWFAALGTAQENPWFGNLLVRLLQASPPVLGLFEHVPFGSRPPRYVRARLESFAFESARDVLARGRWWRTAPLGIYFPVVGNRTGQ